MKYVVYQGKENVLRDRLTDLKNDPGEMNNLVSNPRYKEDLKRLRARLIEWTKKINGSDAAEYLIPPN